MSTQTKKSPDNTHKLNRRAICLRAPLALIILLTVFLAPQRSASTQALSQNPAAQDTPTQTEMINGHKAVAGQVIVRFNDADGPQLETFVKNAIEMVNASGNRNIAPDLNMYHISSNSMNTQALLNMMSKLPGVMYAVPNYIVETQLTPNDTRFGEMWGLNNTGQVVGGQTGIAGADISAVQAWDVSTGSNSIVVGVIDTGVDYNHPDLAANIWSAPSSFTVTVGGQTITCPAGSHGFNAVANTCNAPNVLSVAATDNRDAKSSFSNFGATTVDLGAPGTAILSTVRNGGFSIFSGTSMDTPHVSGAASLVLSRFTLSTANLKATLMNTVDQISSLAGRTVTGGRLNVNRSLRACAGGGNQPTTVFFDNFGRNHATRNHCQRSQ